MAANSSFENSWADQWDPEPLTYEHHKIKNAGHGTNSSSKFSNKVGDTFDKTKSAASTGVKKVKDGASVGFNWIKDKCNRKNHK